MTGYCKGCGNRICICKEILQHGVTVDLDELVRLCCEYLSGEKPTKNLQNFIVWNYPKEAKKFKLKEIR